MRRRQPFIDGGGPAHRCVGNPPLLAAVDGEEVPFTAVNCVVQSPSIGFLDLEPHRGLGTLTTC